MPKVNLCLWRDAHDSDQITIGSVSRDSTVLGFRNRYTAWLTCHIDALLFLADKRLVDRINAAAPEDFPLPLEIEIRLLSE